MNTTNTFITVPEIQEVLSVSESKAYRIVRKLNEELKQKRWKMCGFCTKQDYILEYDAGYGWRNGNGYGIW